MNQPSSRLHKVRQYLAYHIPSCFHHGSRCTREKQNQNLEMQRKRRKQRFFGVVTLAQPFSSPARLLLSSRQYPQKTSAPSASSAFQDFGFDFVLAAAPSRCI